MEATSELPQYTTAIYCTKYCALSGLNSFFVMCFARSKYSSTVNWSALFETPTVGHFPRCFIHFLQLSSPIVTDTPLLKVRKVCPDSHCVYLRELSKFQFLLNFKLLAPSWELVNCRTFRWFLFMLMQSTDIGCKEIVLVGSHVVVPKLQYKSGLKEMMEKMAEKL